MDKNELKLLDNLEKLNGLPLEKEGKKIKDRLNISDEMKEKVEGISNPYIMIEGKRDEAIKLAAYIYLGKSTVYSSLYLHEEYKKVPASPFLRKAERASTFYIELFHSKNEKGVVLPQVLYTYLNQNGYIEQGQIRAKDWIYNHMDFVDYYKGGKYKPSSVKGIMIRNAVYVNRFGYMDWDEHLGNINMLEVMEKGGSIAMTCLDVLRYKGTVLLLDFMKSKNNKDCNELQEFAKRISGLKEGTPGFLIVHTDNRKIWPSYFLDQFDVVPLNSKDYEAEKQKENTVVAPVSATAKPNEQQEEKISHKRSGYLRLGNHPDNKFYAAAKGINGEKALKLSPTSQEYKLLRHLYNIYGTKNSKASSEDILIACDIQGHEKGEAVTEKKVNIYGR